MEREFVRGPGRKLRRVKKCSPSSEEKRSPSFRGAASTFQGQSPGLGGRTHNSSVKEKEDEIETEDMVGRGDFRGVYSKDSYSRFRKMLIVVVVC